MLSTLGSTFLHTVFKPRNSDNKMPTKVKPVKGRLNTSEMSFFRKVKLSLVSPTQFYNKTRNEKGFKASSIYLAAMALVASILSTLSNVIFKTPSLLWSPLVNVVVLWILTFVIFFVLAAITHIFVYFLGGKNGFLQTFKSYVYGYTPGYLLEWIPYVSILVSIYTFFYLIPKGISIQHNMRMGRAIASVILPFVVLILILIAILGAAFLAILSGATTSALTA